MQQSVFVKATSKTVSIPVVPVCTDKFEQWLKPQDSALKQWVKTAQFTAETGSVCLAPDSDGNIQFALLGLKNADDFWAFGALPSKLPVGIFHIEKNTVLKSTQQLERAYLAFALGHYQFSRYKKSISRNVQMVLSNTICEKYLSGFVEAITLARDLINTPAEDMGPQEIENAVKHVAKTHGARVTVIEGDALLKNNYPTMHAVGRASTRAPRMIDLRWKPSKARPRKKITLIGKGVCFDSGGLNIKNTPGMLLMKKDMAGSAMALALAKLIMVHELPVELRLLIGAVDNVISGNSYKPGDVIRTRSKKTVEVFNTDAEGRLVLCDLITEACQEKPDLMVDFATLTGAGRVALGEDIPAFFSNYQPLANQVMKAAEKVNDPIWQLPLVESYRDKLKSEIADMTSCVESSPYGGCITAALFLESFVENNVKWLHFDTCAWHFKPKSGRPIGGDAFGIRAVFELIKNFI